MNRVLSRVAPLFLCAVAWAQTPQQSQSAAERIGEINARDDVKSLLDEKGVQFYERALMEEYGAFGVSIEAALLGGGDGLFVFAVPLAGMGGGVTWEQELAFAFIDRVLQEPPPFDTLVCFLADNWPAVRQAASPYIGLRALLDEVGGRSDALIMYCDFSARPSAPVLVRGRGQAAPPLELAELFLSICDREKIPCGFVSGGYGIDRVVAEHGGGVPVLFIEGSEAAVPETIEADAVIAIFYDFAASALPNASGDDHNYAFIGFGGKRIFISEYALVLMTLFVPVFCFFSLYCALKTRHKRIFVPLAALALFLTAPLFVFTSLNGGKRMPSSNETASLPAGSGARGENLPSFFSGGDRRAKAENEKYLNVTTDSLKFLERRIVRIVIEARQIPLHYRLFFTGRGEDRRDYFVYDAPMPYIADGGRVEFILGEYPPAFLDFEITLPLDAAGDFILDALFKDGANIIETVMTVDAPSVP